MPCMTPHELTSYRTPLVPSYPTPLVPSYPTPLLPSYPTPLLPWYPTPLVPSYLRTAKSLRSITVAIKTSPRPCGGMVWRRISLLLVAWRMDGW